MKRVEVHLETELRDKLSSRGLKRMLNADELAPRTWAKIVKKAILPSVTWKLEGQSLIRLTAKHFGFDQEAA